MFHSRDTCIAKGKCAMSPFAGGSLHKYHEALSLVDLRGVFRVLACLLTGGTAYHLLGGHFDLPAPHTSAKMLFQWISLFLEVIGLLMLRYKIAAHKSVKGISGMTMVMYAAVYAGRIGLTWDG